MDPWWVDPKFSTAQIHIPIPNRKFCLMFLAFCRTKDWVMQNHGLRLVIHRNQISIWDWDMDLGCREFGIWSSCVQSLYYQKYPKIPQNLFCWSTQSAKIFWIHKNSHWVSVVCGIMNLRTWHFVSMTDEEHDSRYISWYFIYLYLGS